MKLDVSLSRPRRPRLVIGLFFGVVIVTAIALNLAALASQILTEVEADRLFTWAFFADLLYDGGNMESWNMGQHSDFFPDKVLAGIAFLMTRKIEVWLQIYAAAIVALYFAVAWTFFTIHRRAAYPPVSPNGGSLLLAFLVTVVTLAAWNQGLFILFLRDTAYPSHHYAASLCGVLGGLLAIDAFSGGRWIIAKRVPVAAALLFLAAVSDKIVVPVALPSFLIAVVFYAVITRRVSTGMLVSCLGVIGAIAGAYRFGDELNNMVAEVSNLPLKLHPETMLDQAQVFGRAWFEPGIPAQFWCAVVLVATAAALLAVNVVAAVRTAIGRIAPTSPDQAKSKALIVFLISTAIVNPLAIIAVGGFEEPLHARETVAVLFCLLWAAAAQLDRGVMLSAPRGAMAGLTAAIALLVCIPVRDALAARPWAANVEVPLLHCIRHFEASYPLKKGLGFHWDSLPVTLFSGGRTTILTTIYDARIWHWINNLDWYAPNPDQPFTFIVRDPVMVTEAGVIERAGNPAHVLNCADAGADAGTKSIWVFDPPEAARLTAWITEQYHHLKRLQAEKASAK